MGPGKSHGPLKVKVEDRKEGEGDVTREGKTGETQITRINLPLLVLKVEEEKREPRPAGGPQQLAAAMG